MIVTALLAWLLANGLDILTMLLMARSGLQLLLFGGMMLHRPAEFFLLYAGMRLLLTLAVGLLALWADKHWPVAAVVLWNVLTFCSLVTAVLAWLRFK